METLSLLLSGLESALTPINLMYCFLGVLLGTAVGVIPGIGPGVTLSLLLPLCYHLPPTASLIMMAGIYYGTMYGGSTSAILLRLPGEPSSLIIAKDGHDLAKAGRAGAALTVAAVGSFVAGTFATMVLSLTIKPLSEFALQFGPADYSVLMLLTFGLVISVAQSSWSKNIIAAALGAFLAMIGPSTVTGEIRFTLGLEFLNDGINLAVLVMGLFALGEIMARLTTVPLDDLGKHDKKNFYPTMQEWRQALPAIGRGSIMGTIIGVLPAAGSILSSMLSYVVEKKINPKEITGSGSIQRVAGPESANNAGAQISFVPMLTLGLPTHTIMALLMSVMVIHGITPGPYVITHNPDVFWALIASFWVGNLMLLILNLPLIRIWIQLLRLPHRVIKSLVIVLCIVGAYSIRNDPADIAILLLLAVIGYILIKYQFDIIPLVMTFVLTRIGEEYFVRSLQISQGDIAIFFSSSISLALWGLIVLTAATITINLIVKKFSPKSAVDH